MLDVSSGTGNEPGGMATLPVDHHFYICTNLIEKMCKREKGPILFNKPNVLLNYNQYNQIQLQIPPWKNRTCYENWH